MLVQIDSREHRVERERIERQFDVLGIEHYVSKLYVGDYMSLDNPRLCIDRKKDLNELCSNVCQQHERFRAELIRAQKTNIKLIILCEHGADITDIVDVYFWENPRIREWEKRLRLKNWKYHALPLPSLLKHLEADGIPERELRPPINGNQLYKSLETIKNTYDVGIMFCDKQNTGKVITDILGG